MDENPEEELAAPQRLNTALQAAGWHRALISTSDDGAVTAILIMDGVNQRLLGSDFLLAFGATRAFEAALDRHGVHATVTPSTALEPDFAVSVRLRQDVDALALAALILDNLSEPQAAAYRLGTALTATGIKANGIRVTRDGLITIGNLTADGGLTLGQVVLGRPWPEELNLYDWHDLERLATGLTQTLTMATGAKTLVDADPCCHRCCGVNEVTIGLISAEQAHRLAETVEASTGTTELAQSAES